MPDVGTQTDVATRTYHTQTWGTAANYESQRRSTRIRNRTPTPAPAKRGQALAADERRVVCEERATSPMRAPPGLLCGVCGGPLAFLG